MDRLAAMIAFAKVVDTGSFSAAARQLGVGQPAVSKSVAALESLLGTRLLTRSTRGLSPTEAGLAYYDHARRAIEAAEAAEQAARASGAGLSGRLRVSAAVTFARLHLVPLLDRFMARHPALSIDLILDDRPIDLIEEGVDLALRMGGLPEATAIGRRIGSSPRAALASPAYLARAGTPTQPSDLAGHAAILYTQARGDDWTFARGDLVQSVTLRGRLRVSSAEGVRAAVLAGMGIAIAAHWMFAPELASGAVVPLFDGWRLPANELWAVYPGGRLASAKARALTDFIERGLAAAAIAPPG